MYGDNYRSRMGCDVLDQYQANNPIFCEHAKEELSAIAASRTPGASGKRFRSVRPTGCLERGMAGIAAIVLICLASIVPARSQSLEQPDLPDEQSCQEAAEKAERDWDLPSGLLVAIGQVESGRRIAGRSAPWPWTTNAAGKGRFHKTKADAVSEVMTLQAKGVRTIDVGCFQVNLLHHPAAFSSLQEALDPRANAAYAARFLSSLHKRTRSWDSAIAFYHSATPALGNAYRSRVFASWMPANSVPHRPEIRIASNSAAAWPLSGGWVAARPSAGVRVWVLPPGASAARVVEISPERLLLSRSLQ